MDRLQVNKDTFEALIKVINLHGEDMVMNYHSESPTDWDKNYEALNSLSIPQMARALYVGYDLKPTPQEAILGYYNNAKELAVTGDHEMKLEYNAICEAVDFVLCELNIQIKGINA